jgi:hypothetical protein
MRASPNAVHLRGRQASRHASQISVSRELQAADTSTSPRLYVQVDSVRADDHPDAMRQPTSIWGFALAFYKFEMG